MNIKMVLKYDSYIFVRDFLKNLEFLDEDDLDELEGFSLKVSGLNFLEDLYKDTKIEIQEDSNCDNIEEEFIIYCNESEKFDIIERIKNIDCNIGCSDCLLNNFGYNYSDFCYNITNLYADNRVAFVIK